MADADQMSMEMLMMLFRDLLIPGGKNLALLSLRAASLAARGTARASLGAGGLAVKGGALATGAIGDRMVGHGKVGVVGGKALNDLADELGSAVECMDIPDGFAREDVAALSRGLRRRGVACSINYVTVDRQRVPVSMSYLGKDMAQITDALRLVAREMGATDREVGEAEEPSPDRAPAEGFERGGLDWAPAEGGEAPDGAAAYEAQVCGPDGTGRLRARAAEDGSWEVLTPDGGTVTLDGAPLAGREGDGQDGIYGACDMARAQACAALDSELVRRSVDAGLVPERGAAGRVRDAHNRVRSRARSAARGSFGMTSSELISQTRASGAAARSRAHGHKVTHAPRRSMGGSR